MRSRFDPVNPICKNPKKDQLAQGHQESEKLETSKSESRIPGEEEELHVEEWGCPRREDEGEWWGEGDHAEYWEEDTQEEIRKRDRERRALLMLAKDCIRSNFGL